MAHFFLFACVLVLPWTKIRLEVVAVGMRRDDVFLCRMM